VQRGCTPTLDYAGECLQNQLHYCLGKGTTNEVEVWDSCGAGACQTDGRCGGVGAACCPSGAAPGSSPADGPGSSCDPGSYGGCVGNDAYTCPAGTVIVTPCGADTCTGDGPAASCTRTVAAHPASASCDASFLPACDGPTAVKSCVGGMLQTIDCPGGEACANGSCQ
jgi:hypothetical protein